MIGLVTGSEPFAGLPTNPAEIIAAQLDGWQVDGVTIRGLATPVSYRRLPLLLPGLVQQHGPAFVLGLGVQLGASLISVERVALNAAHFEVADAEGERPRGGVPLEPGGPPARLATWDADAVAAAILQVGVPAKTSFNAGTHLCNLTLYTYLRALEGTAVPCGFLHLPYLPEQVVWLMQNRPTSATAQSNRADQPSMGLALQLTAVRAAIRCLTRQATALERTS